MLLAAKAAPPPAAAPASAAEEIRKLGDLLELGLTPGYPSNEIIMMWEIELHAEVQEWLLALPTAEFQRAAWYVDLLEAEGLALKEPYTRQLDGALRELRFHLGDTRRRSSFFNIGGPRLVLLTVFRKQRARERAEIRRAVRQMNRCIAERHTAEES